jgi:hypothetical protein
MGQEEDIKRVSELISLWVTKIKINNYVNFYDINKVAEDLSLKLLNEIYDYNLENLNDEKVNFPSIDLGDKVKKIAFQITSRKDVKKIHESLQKFAKGPNKTFFNGIRFLILTQDRKPRLKKEKYQSIYPNFDPQLHIFNVGDLIFDIKKIYCIDKNKFYRILDILEDDVAEKVIKKRKFRTGQSILKHLKDCTKSKLVSLIISGNLTLDQINTAIMQNEGEAITLLRSVEKQYELHSDKWFHLLCNHIASRLSDPTQPSFEISFDDSYDWRARNIAISWMRFCPHDRRQKSESRLIGIDNDLPWLIWEIKRLVTSGLGFLGKLDINRDFKEKELVLDDEYTNRKLGYDMMRAYLNCFIYHKHNLALLDFSKVYNATLNFGDEANFPDFDFDTLFHVIQPGSIKVLFEHCYKRKHWSFLKPLLLEAFTKKPFSMLFGQLRGIIENSSLGFLHQAALFAMANIKSPESVEYLSSLDNNVPGVIESFLLAIGVNAAFEYQDDLMRNIDSNKWSSPKTLYALWSLGELAKKNKKALEFLKQNFFKSDGLLLKSLCLLGLVKAGEEISRTELEVAMDTATVSYDKLIIGIAATILGQFTVLEKAIHHLQENGPTIWLFQGHIYRDFIEVLENHGGSMGQTILELLNIGDVV